MAVFQFWHLNFDATNVRIWACVCKCVSTTNDGCTNSTSSLRNKLCSCESLSLSAFNFRSLSIRVKCEAHQYFYGRKHKRWALTLKIRTINCDTVECVQQLINIKVFALIVNHFSIWTTNKSHISKVCNINWREENERKKNLMASVQEVRRNLAENIAFMIDFFANFITSQRTKSVEIPTLPHFSLTFFSNSQPTD